MAVLTKLRRMRSLERWHITISPYPTVERLVAVNLFALFSGSVQLSWLCGCVLSERPFIGMGSSHQHTFTIAFSANITNTICYISKSAANSETPAQKPPPKEKGDGDGEGLQLPRFSWNPPENFENWKPPWMDFHQYESTIIVKTIEILLIVHLIFCSKFYAVRRHWTRLL